MKQAMKERRITHEMSLLAGQWPEDIAGHHWINGLGEKLPWQRENHSPPGVLQRFDLRPTNDGRLLWHVRESHAPDVRAAMAHPEVFEDPRASIFFGEILTTCNAAFVQLGERLFVTADENRPWEIDLASMELCTAVGTAREWGGSSILSMLSPYIPTSAHPFHDEVEGVIYNYTSKSYPKDGTSLSSYDHHLSITRWSGDGPLRRWEVPGANIKQYIHQICATRNFLVLLEASSYDPRFGMSLFRMADAEPHMPVAHLYVIRKSHLSNDPSCFSVPFRKIAIPLEAIHMLVDYEDDGIHLDLWLAHANGLDLTLGNTLADISWTSGKRFHFSQLGAYPHADYSPFGRYRVHVEEEKLLDSHRVIELERFWGAGIWSHDRRINPADGSIYASWSGFDPALVSKRLMDKYGDRPNRILPPNTLPQQVFNPALTEIDWRSGAIRQSYVYPSPEIITIANQFIPRRRSQGGWLGAYLVMPKRNVEYWLFDAESLSQGPIARLGCKFLRPVHTVHHTYTDEARPREARYYVSPEEDLGTDWHYLPEPLRGVVEEAIKLGTKHQHRQH